MRRKLPPERWNIIRDHGERRGEFPAALSGDRCETGDQEHYRLVLIESEEPEDQIRSKEIFERLAVTVTELRKTGEKDWSQAYRIQQLPAA